MTKYKTGIDLVPQVYAHIRGVSVIQGVWIRVVSAIQGSGLEGCLQFMIRGLD